MSKRLGRRPTFDRDQVVAAAIGAFWAKGFQRTTLSDLEEATGVDRSTLYNSFDGKSGLHRSACAAYVRGAEEYLFESLLTGTAGTADVLSFLDRLATELTAETHPRGCLIVNDMTDAGDPVATERYLRSLETGLGLALSRSAESGETDPAMIEHRKHLLVAAILGLNLSNKSAGHLCGTADVLEGIRKEVEGWINPPTVERPAP